MQSGHELDADFVTNGPQGRQDATRPRPQEAREEPMRIATGPARAGFAARQHDQIGTERHITELSSMQPTVSHAKP